MAILKATPTHWARAKDFQKQMVRAKDFRKVTRWARDSAMAIHWPMVILKAIHLRSVKGWVMHWLKVRAMATRMDSHWRSAKDWAKQTPMVTVMRMGLD